MRYLFQLFLLQDTSYSNHAGGCHRTHSAKFLEQDGFLRDYQDSRGSIQNEINPMSRHSETHKCPHHSLVDTYGAPHALPAGPTLDAYDDGNFITILDAQRTLIYRNTALFCTLSSI